MELDLFQFIDETIELYDLHKAGFEYAESVLCQFFERLKNENSSDVVAVHSRVKSRDSLREKLLRNKFYMQYEKPIDAISSLSDIVGITLECRFIRNEVELYHTVLRDFSEPNEDGYAICLQNPDILLNLGTLNWLVH